MPGLMHRAHHQTGCHPRGGDGVRHQFSWRRKGTAAGGGGPRTTTGRRRGKLGRRRRPAGNTVGKDLDGSRGPGSFSLFSGPASSGPGAAAAAATASARGGALGTAALLLEADRHPAGQVDKLSHIIIVIVVVFIVLVRLRLHLRLELRNERERKSTFKKDGYRDYMFTCLQWTRILIANSYNTESLKGSHRMADGPIFLKISDPLRLINRYLSNEPNFSRINLAGQYL
jgi:hypothetical protein